VSRSRVKPANGSWRGAAQMAGQPVEPVHRRMAEQQRDRSNERTDMATSLGQRMNGTSARQRQGARLAKASSTPNCESEHGVAWHTDGMAMPQREMAPAEGHEFRVLRPRDDAHRRVR
jgi:hypothetical protein